MIQRQSLLILPAAFLFLLVLPTALLYGAEADQTLHADENDLQWFRDAKFGLFIHWGPVSLKGTEIGWSRGGDRKFPDSRGSQVPAEVYDNLYQEFNPTKFNADEWAAVAKAAGMKYLVFTTKHHDGFCMFDSQLSDYKITNSPFKRDVVKELADACHKANLKLGFYHSPPDWRHPDYFTENHERYIQYLHGQVRELCSNYGKVSILWYDGLGGKPEDWGSYEMIPMVYKMQPGILINNRAGLPCDYDTPEQRVGKFQNDRAWETCMTICQQWAWKPDDRLKSLKECIDILVRTVGGDGNLLLNVGPMPTGEIEPRQVDRLKEIGAWLKKYGRTIYNTRGGPFITGSWGGSTYRGDMVFLHVVDWDDRESILLPKIDKTIVSSRVLTGGEASIRETEKGIEVVVPSDQRDELDTIIALRLDGPARDVPAMALPLFHSLSSGREAQCSNVYQNNNWAHGPAKAFDDDASTRWATDSGVKQAWLSVDLGEPKTFDRAVIREAYDRVQEFELQIKQGDSWKPFYQGRTIGEKKTIQFDPVTGRHVRLQILDAKDGPTIWEFQIFEAK
ncbi:MAG: alpha-L-fucosidase [Candidatus Omnitrophica bacterium]|nr:alpha-L-fucosidase [Candidatus Omnitrophota bacterium]